MEGPSSLSETDSESELSLEPPSEESSTRSGSELSEPLSEPDVSEASGSRKSITLVSTLVLTLTGACFILMSCFTCQAVEG